MAGQASPSSQIVHRCDAHNTATLRCAAHSVPSSSCVVCKSGLVFHDSRSRLHHAFSDHRDTTATAPWLHRYPSSSRTIR